MMKDHSLKRQHGQSLVLFAVGLLALLAVAALVIDGGNMYLNRRIAQTAADAGALAGAYEMCAGGGSAAAVATAIQYATDENGVSNATANIVGDEIIVDAYIDQTSFFAQVLGINQVQVPATAAASCFPPNSLKSVLPISWACKPPTLTFPTDSLDCQITSLNWKTEMTPLITGVPSAVDINGTNVATPFDFKEDFLPEIYIIMDSNSTIEDTAVNCAPYGEMNCDINGDGKDDIIGNGDRSWLDLDGGGGGASSLTDWIENGFDGTLGIHTWVAGQTGVEGSVFKTVNDTLTGHVALIPVFNQYCIGDPEDALCQENAHNTFPLLAEQEEEVVWTSANSATYFHIVGFAEFYVSCVAKNGGNNVCPGHDAAVDAGVFDKNTKTIEGYFVTGYPAGAGSGGTGGVNLGVFVRSLTK